MIFRGSLGYRAIPLVAENGTFGYSSAVVRRPSEAVVNGFDGFGGSSYKCVGASGAVIDIFRREPVIFGQSSCRSLELRDHTTPHIELVDNHDQRLRQLFMLR